MAVLKRVPVRWVQIQAPDTRYEHQWSLDALLTKEQAKTLTEAAKAANSKVDKAANYKEIKIKKDEDGQLYYKFARKVNKSDGSGENTKPACVDGHRKDLTCLIGNGSICNIQYNVYSWENKFGAGAGVDFMGMQVLDLVSYGGSDGDEFEDEEGSVDEFETEDNSTGAPTEEDYDDEDFS